MIRQACEYAMFVDEIRQPALAESSIQLEERIWKLQEFVYLFLSKKHKSNMMPRLPSPGLLLICQDRISR